MNARNEEKSKPVNRRVIIERICPGLAIVHFEPPVRLQVLSPPSIECSLDEDEKDSDKIISDDESEKPLRK